MDDSILSSSMRLQSHNWEYGEVKDLFIICVEEEVQ